MSVSYFPKSNFISCWSLERGRQYDEVGEVSIGSDACCGVLSSETAAVLVGEISVGRSFLVEKRFFETAFVEDSVSVPISRKSLSGVLIVGI